MLLQPVTGARWRTVPDNQADHLIHDIDGPREDTHATPTRILLQQLMVHGGEHSAAQQSIGSSER